MSAVNRVIRAKTSVDLCAKVYKAHGRVRQAGESQAAFLVEHYTVSVDHERGEFVATPRPAIVLSEKATSIRNPHEAD